jgi:hypothetical protein
MEFTLMEKSLRCKFETKGNNKKNVYFGKNRKVCIPLDLAHCWCKYSLYDVMHLGANTPTTYGTVAHKC